MPEFKAIHPAIMQVVIQTATVAAIALKKVDTEPTPDTSTANTGEVQRYRHDRPLLRQPTFNSKAPDRYIELFFSMEVTAMLQTRAYKKNDEKEIYHQKWLGRERLKLTQKFTNSKKKRHEKWQKGC